MLFEDLFDLFDAIDRSRVDLEVIPLDVADALAGLCLLQRSQEPFVGFAHHSAHRLVGLLKTLRGLSALMLVEVEPAVLHVGHD